MAELLMAPLIVESIFLFAGGTAAIEALVFVGTTSYLTARIDASRP